jgi:hypothetical protein
MNDTERKEFIAKNVETNFFGGPIKHEPIIKEKVKPVKEGNIYTADEITDVLDVLGYFDIDNQYCVIDQDFSNYSDETSSTVGLFKNLIGYQVKVKQKGDHRNDGQMVDYKFTFVSPSGVKTKVWTEMCLMCGWNHCSTETIE